MRCSDCGSGWVQWVWNRRMQEFTHTRCEHCGSTSYPIMDDADEESEEEEDDESGESAGE